MKKTFVIPVKFALSNALVQFGRLYANTKMTEMKADILTAAAVTVTGFDGAAALIPKAKKREGLTFPDAVERFVAALNTDSGDAMQDEKDADSALVDVISALITEGDKTVFWAARSENVVTEILRDWYSERGVPVEKFPLCIIV